MAWVAGISASSASDLNIILLGVGKEWYEKVLEQTLRKKIETTSLRSIKRPLQMQLDLTHYPRYRKADNLDKQAQ